MTTHLMPTPPLVPDARLLCCARTLREPMGPDDHFTFDETFVDCERAETPLATLVDELAALLDHPEGRDQLRSPALTASSLVLAQRLVRLVARRISEPRHHTAPNATPLNVHQMAAVRYQPSASILDDVQRGLAVLFEAYHDHALWEHHQRLQVVSDRLRGQRHAPVSEPPAEQVAMHTEDARDKGQLPRETGLGAQAFTPAVEAILEPLAQLRHSRGLDGLSGSQVDDLRGSAVAVLAALAALDETDWSRTDHDAVTEAGADD